MITISNNGIITVNKGDDFKLTLFINKGTPTKPIRYNLSEKDVVWFRVMSPNQSFPDAIIKKEYTYKDVNANKDVVVKFTHEDTFSLVAGKYYYEVKLKLYNTKTDSFLVHTIIPQTQIVLVE